MDSLQAKEKNVLYTAAKQAQAIWKNSSDTPSNTRSSWHALTHIQAQRVQCDKARDEEELYCCSTRL